jgi:predicted dehydrogenase
MDETRRLRLGLVGCGIIARRHGGWLRHDPRVDWQVVCDPRPEAAESFRNEFATTAKIETDFAAALDRHSLDAVILCTPNAQHYPQSCAALDRGLHVLCEKPLALRREEIDDLIVRTAASGKIVSVAHQRRYLGAYRTARRELTERAELYGPIHAVQLNLCENWSQNIVGTWRDDPTQNLGYFGDAGIHLIDVVHFVSGLQAEQLYAVSDRRGRNVEVTTRALIRWSGGVDGSAQFIGDAHHFREDIHFHSRAADLLIRDGRVLRCCDGRCEPIADPMPDGNPTTAWLDAIESGRPTVSPPEVARPILAWNQAVMASLRTDDWVDVDSSA